MPSAQPNMVLDAGDAASTALLEEHGTQSPDSWSEAELHLAIQAAASRILALTPTGVVEELYPEET
jgi:hypothetical protein